MGVKNKLKSTKAKSGISLSDITSNSKFDDVLTTLVEIKDLMKNPRTREEERSQLLAYAKKLPIELAQKDFYSYVRLMAPTILPEGYEDGRHIRLICHIYQNLYLKTFTGHRKGDKQQIFLPPGSMKTLLTNLFVTWVFGRYPKAKILHIGYSADFAENYFGSVIRDLMSTPDYAAIFPNTKIRTNTRSKSRFETTRGGIYVCSGVGSQIAGKRGHMSICDDVVSEQSAISDAERTKINKWYVPGLRTRLLPKGSSEIIINTRWHLDDISGYMVANDERKWKIFKVPAILNKEQCEKLGIPAVKFSETQEKLLKLKEGNSFWPEFWPLSNLLDKKSDPSMSDHVWNALYMQNPIPEEGNIFKDHHFKEWYQDEPPICDYIIISLDTAFSSKETADFSAYTVWGVFSREERDLRGRMLEISSMILLDADRGRWEFPDLCLKTQEVCDHYHPDWLLIEKKASGQSLIPEFQRRGLPVATYNPDKDKVFRANAASPYMDNGRVWFPNTAFTKEVRTEMSQFPYGTHDDYTDTVTQAILWMRDSFRIGHDNHWSEEVEEDELAAIKGRRKTYWAACTGK